MAKRKPFAFVRRADVRVVHPNEDFAELSLGHLIHGFVGTISEVTVVQLGLADCRSRLGDCAVLEEAANQVLIE